MIPYASINQILNRGAKNLLTADSDEFVSLCLKQVTQHFAAAPTAPSLGVDSPGCALLVQWALLQLGVSFAYNGYLQYQFIVQAQLTCTIDQAISVAGALLFVQGQASPNTFHVGISLGQGNGVIGTIGNAVGVIKRPNNFRWSVAGFIPGLRYSDFNIPNPTIASTKPSDPYSSMT